MDGGDAIAQAEREWLARRRSVLLGLAAEVSHATVPQPAESEWSGPARRAFDAARGRLAAAVLAAACHLDEAARAVARAEYRLAAVGGD